MAKGFWNTFLAVFGIVQYNEPEKVTEVKTMHSADGCRRLSVYSRTNGTYCVREHFYNEKQAEARWEPVETDYAGNFPSAGAALEAAAGALPWLAEAMREQE